MAAPLRSLLVTAAALAFPAVALAQTYGTESTPGGVEAKPSGEAPASRSLSEPMAKRAPAPALESAAPGAPASSDAAAPPAADAEPENSDAGEEPKE